MPLERPGPEDVVEEPWEGVEGWEALLDEGRPAEGEVRFRRGEVGFVAREAPRLEAVDGVWGRVGSGGVGCQFWARLRLDAGMYTVVYLSSCSGPYRAPGGRYLQTPPGSSVRPVPRITIKTRLSD